MCDCLFMLDLGRIPNPSPVAGYVWMNSRISIWSFVSHSTSLPRLMPPDFLSVRSRVDDASCGEVCEARLLTTGIRSNTTAYRSPSQRIQEIRSSIAQLIDLLFALSLGPDIALAVTALGVLATQEHVLQDRTAEQPECFVG
jgi:hypothetical protein